MKSRCTMIFALSVLVFSEPVQAGFNEAMKAFEANNFSLALSEARKAADAGEARANLMLATIYENGMGVPVDQVQAVKQYEIAAQRGIAKAYSRVAQAYARGTGVPRDKDKALANARRAAQLGDIEGSFLQAIIIDGLFLSYYDANGKADYQRYTQLAARPPGERALDSEAKDALYSAAERGFGPSLGALAYQFGSVVGDGNRKRMQALLEKLPSPGNPGLQNYKAIGRQMDALGDSLASPQLFADTQVATATAAALQACGSRQSLDAGKPPRLMSAKVAKPLARATYLASKVAGYERAYLIAGQWEEDWTFSACDKTAVVKVKFSADGLGGARYATEQAMKPN